jgi:hypothetical protein
VSSRICWDCPFLDGIPTCDPSRARCPEPPLSAEEQERVAQSYDGIRRRVWLTLDVAPELLMPIAADRKADKTA